MKVVKFIKNEYIFSVITKIVLLFVGVAYSALLARYLGATIKGEVAYILSITNIGAIILTLGVHQAYPYYRKKLGEDSFLTPYMNAVITIFFIYIMLAVLACVYFYNRPDLIAITILMPIMGYSRIVGYVYLVERPIKRNMMLLIINVVEILYILALMIFTESNFAWAISIILLKELYLCIYFTVKINFKFSFYEIKKEIIFKLISYGFLPMVTLLLSTLNYRIDVLMLGQFSNIDYAQIGIYSIGVALAERAWLIPDSVKDILLSKLAKGKGSDEVAMVMRVCFPLSLLMVVGIVILGEPFINLLYGVEFRGAYLITVVSVFGTVSMVFYKMIATYNIVNKKQVFNLTMLIISVLVNVVINAFLIPILGILGSAIATVISYLVCAIIFIIYFSKKTGIRKRDILLINKNDIALIKGLIGKKKKEIK